MTKPTKGRIVLVAFKNYLNHVVERPAIVVEPWGPEGDAINVMVFPDGGNDGVPVVVNHKDGHVFQYGCIWRTVFLIGRFQQQIMVWVLQRGAGRIGILNDPIGTK